MMPETWRTFDRWFIGPFGARLPERRVSSAERRAFVAPLAEAVKAFPERLPPSEAFVGLGLRKWLPAAFEDERFPERVAERLAPWAAALRNMPPTYGGQLALIDAATVALHGAYRGRCVEESQAPYGRCEEALRSARALAVPKGGGTDSGVLHQLARMAGLDARAMRSGASPNGDIARWQALRDDVIALLRDPAAPHRPGTPPPAGCVGLAQILTWGPPGKDPNAKWGAYFGWFGWGAAVPLDTALREERITVHDRAWLACRALPWAALQRPILRMLERLPADPDGVVSRVAGLYRRSLAGDLPAVEEWTSTRAVVRGVEDALYDTDVPAWASAMSAARAVEARTEGWAPAQLSHVAARAAGEAWASEYRAQLADLVEAALTWAAD